MHRLIKFGLVGILNTAFGYLLFATLVWLTDGPKLSLLVATVVGVLFNFMTTGRLVFYSRGFKMLLPFVLAYGVVYLVNACALDSLIWLGIRAELAQLFCLPFVAFLAYFINARFVFEERL